MRIETIKAIYIKWEHPIVVFCGFGLYALNTYLHGHIYYIGPYPEVVSVVKVGKLAVWCPCKEVSHA